MFSLIRYSPIRRRLLGSYLLLMAVVWAVVTSAGMAGMEWYYRSAIADLLRVRAQSDRTALERLETDLVLAGQEFAQERALDLGARLQLYDAEGRLLGDSTLALPPGAPLPQPGTVPEVEAALAGGERAERLVREEGERRYHLAEPVRSADGAVIGALRYSTSLGEVDALLLRVLGLLLLAGLAVLGLTALIGLWLARSLVHPLTELTEVAAAMSRGDLSARARVHRPDEVGRLAEAFNKMAESLAEVDRLRSDFLRRVSHELKTPLAAIKAWTVTLQDEDVTPEELEQGLATVERSADHLTRMVEDLLLVARMQAGVQISLSPAPVDAAEAVRAAVQAMAARAREAGVELTLPGPEDTASIFFDPDRLAQILTNLLENAIKFTPRGGRVSVRIEPLGEGEVQLTVSDTGRGIPENEIGQLTQPFFRGRGAAAVPGTGLGLAIVGELLRLGGGRMAIESRVGEGTQVHLFLPAAKEGLR